MGSPAIFNGQFTKLLTPFLKFKDFARILTGTDDPSAVATDGEKGSLFLRQTAAGDGQVFYKLDDGSSTNWKLLGSFSAEAANLAAKIDDIHENSPYLLYTRSLAELDASDVIDTYGGTAALSQSQGAYSLPAISDSILTTNLLDQDEFLDEEKDVNVARIAAFFKEGGIDDQGTWEISRDGGGHWNTVSMERAGDASTAFVGDYRWTEESDQVTDGTLTPYFSEYEVTDGAGTQESLATKFTFTNESMVISLRTYLSRLGTISGNYRYAIFTSNGSEPVSRVFTTAWQDAASVATSSTAYDIDVSAARIFLAAGAEYFLVLEVDDAYRASFSTGVNALRWSYTNSGSNLSYYLDGVVWTAFGASEFLHQVTAAEESFTSIVAQAVDDDIFPLNATSVQELAQLFTLADTNVLKRINLPITVVGNPTGLVYIQVVREVLGEPSSLEQDILAETTIDISTLSTGTMVVDIAPTVLGAGDYFIVAKTNQTYKDGYSGGVTELQLRTATSGPDGALANNGSIWVDPGTYALVYDIEGRPLDLQVRYTAGTTNTLLRGFAVYYEHEVGGAINGGQLLYDKESFKSISDNLNEFELSWLPDPYQLKVYVQETGQVFTYPSFSIEQNKVVFPLNFFYDLYNGDDLDVTLIFDQTSGFGVDYSEENANRIATIEQNNYKPTYQTISFNYSAKSGDQILAYSSGGPFSVTLPADPEVGDRVVVLDAERTFNTNNVTMLRNGELIEGIADDMDLDAEGLRYEFIFVGGSFGWRLF